MKNFPSNILIEIGKKTQNINPILFYGNESGLIIELIKSIYSSLQKKLDLSEIIYFDYKNNNDDELEEILKSSSLFSKINFIVIKNPQERLVKQLENIDKQVNILLINGENLRTNSKLKLYFENHQKFIGVPCYKLQTKDIKNLNTTVYNTIFEKLTDYENR